VRIKKGLQKKLTLGNLYAVRDWGHAKDYAVSMWKILQYKKPDDWVIATNKENTVKNFVNLTAKKLTIKIKWIGKGIKEKAIDMNTKKTIIDLDPKFLRPTEVDFLRGDFSKARKKLKWKPLISTNELIDDMIQDEMNR
jgi:GDPmannose 4,6-dehydratase